MTERIVTNTVQSEVKDNLNLFYQYHFFCKSNVSHAERTKQII